ncbi:MAG: RNA polymerase sigma factor [Steroidobacteraceae bacterium]
MSSDPVESAASLANTVFRNHSGELKRYLARRVRHSQDADDLAQEVFARILRVRDADMVRNPLAYVLGIATNVVREFRQRKQYGRVLFDSDVTDDLCETLEQLATHDHAEQLELQNRLNLALAQLPTTHRLVLLLVKRDGLSYTEAAKSSGLSVHTIEKYVVESRARLRLLLVES